MRFLGVLMLISAMSGARAPVLVHDVRKEFQRTGRAKYRSACAKPRNLLDGFHPGAHKRTLSKEPEVLRIVLGSGIAVA